jgi:hypothetical protein
MIEISIRTLCATYNDALNAATELDRAVKILGGYREQVLESDSTWDNWFFHEDRYYLLPLFISNSKIVFRSRSEDARYGYKTKGNHPRKKIMDVAKESNL